MTQPSLLAPGGAVPVLCRSTRSFWIAVLMLLLCATCARAQVGDTGRLKTHQLDTVIVKGHKLPFVVKGDTLEFNATAFKVLPNAAVKDLLKKLPGVIVAADGAITVNGKKVSTIQVEGREFLGGDVKTATANLSAEVIDKIQVTGTKTLTQQRSLSVQPPAEEVTINLVFKKDKKAGWLGNVMAGAGTEKRYTANGMLNHFGSKTTVNAWGTAGNSGGANGAVMMPVAGGAGGFNEDQTGIVSINTRYGKELTVDVFYNFARRTTSQQASLNRLNLLADSSFTYYSDKSSGGLSNHHALSLNIKYEPDSLTVWTFRPAFSWNHTNNTNRNLAFSQSNTGKPINNLASMNNSTSGQFGFNNQAVFNKSSRNKKINLNISWDINIENRGEQLHNLSINQFYSGGSVSDADSINQQSNGVNHGITNKAKIDLSGKLSEHLVAAVNYSVHYSRGNLKKKTFDYNPGSEKYDVLDSLLSNDNNTSNLTQMPAVQFAWRGKQLNIALNTGMWFVNQENRLQWADSVVHIRQQQFVPNLQWQYTLNKYFNLSGSYFISFTGPSASQLSPVADNSNPLYIKVGNPSLKTGMVHDVNASISGYMPHRGINVHAMARGSLTRNQIVNDVHYDSLGRQVSTWRNVNGASRMMIMGNLGVSRKWQEWSITTSLGTSATSNREVSFVSARRNNLDKLSFNAHLYMSVDWSNWLSLSPAAVWGWNRSKYSLDNLQDASFYNRSYRLQLQVTGIKRMAFSFDVNDQYDNQVANPDYRRFTICNTSLSYRFLPKEQLTITAAVKDIFNKSRYVSTSIGDSYRETVQTNGLRRFGLLSLAWNFNRMHGHAQALPCTL